MSVSNSTDEEKADRTVQSVSEKVEIENSCKGKEKKDEAPGKQKKKRRKALEVFCGCAGLTLSLTNEWVDGAGVDYIGNGDSPEEKTILLDASTSLGQRRIREEARLIREASDDAAARSGRPFKVPRRHQAGRPYRGGRACHPGTPLH